MRISDWSSDVCSSDLDARAVARLSGRPRARTGDGVARGRRGGVARHALLRDRERQEIRLFHRGPSWRRKNRLARQDQRRRRAGGADRDGRSALLPAGLFRRRLGRGAARSGRHRLGCDRRVVAQELAGGGAEEAGGIDGRGRRILTRKRLPERSGGLFVSALLSSEEPTSEIQSLMRISYAVIF